MLPLYITITAYDSIANTCTAETDTGVTLKNFDPFVGCAVKMTDDQYHQGFGNSFVGKRYLMTEYSVYSSSIVPHENCLLEVSK